MRDANQVKGKKPTQRQTALARVGRLDQHEAREDDGGHHAHGHLRLGREEDLLIEHSTTQVSCSRKSLSLSAPSERSRHSHGSISQRNVIAEGTLSIRQTRMEVRKSL